MAANTSCKCLCLRPDVCPLLIRVVSDPDLVFSFGVDVLWRNLTDHQREVVYNRICAAAFYDEEGVLCLKSSSNEFVASKIANDALYETIIFREVSLTATAMENIRRANGELETQFKLPHGVRLQEEPKQFGKHCPPLVSSIPELGPTRSTTTHQQARRAEKQWREGMLRTAKDIVTDAKRTDADAKAMMKLNTMQPILAAQTKLREILAEQRRDRRTEKPWNHYLNLEAKHRVLQGRNTTTNATTVGEERLTYCGVENVLLFPGNKALGVLPPVAPTTLFERPSMDAEMPGVRLRDPPQRSRPKSRVSWYDLESLDEGGPGEFAQTIEEEFGFPNYDGSSVRLPLIGTPKLSSRSRSRQRTRTSSREMRESSSTTSLSRTGARLISDYF